MARAKRLLRISNMVIPGLGECKLEVKEDRLRLLVRETGEAHAWTWEQLIDICQCESCLAKKPPENVSFLEL